MTKTARMIAATSISIFVFVLPQHVQADSSLRPSEVSSFTAALPRIDEIPWLASKKHAFKPRHYESPQAGSVSALLFTPTPASAWPRRLTRVSKMMGTYTV